MYDYDELSRAWMKFLQEFELDAFSGPGLVYPGKGARGCRLQISPLAGPRLGDDISSYQFIEGEYMAADEYDAFIRGPGRFSPDKVPASVDGAFAALVSSAP